MAFGSKRGARSARVDSLIAYARCGIMATMAEIVEQALPLGASLKGCAKAGFRPYMIRTESWHGFRLRQSFRVLEEPALYPFERESCYHICR
jgi:hypothetical protein